jgi:hypothetical protein
MTSALFLGFLTLVAGTIVAAAARAFSRRAALTTAAVLGIWFTYVGALALSGVISNASLRPPGIAFVVLPAFAFVAVFFVRSPIGGRVSLAFPVWALIGFETYRVGVELFLHRLAGDGLVPKMLTFEGANFELAIALSAPIAAWICTQGRPGLRVSLAWNALGLLSLANVATRALLTAPGPLHVLHSDVPNVAFGIFPYTFVPGFFAPLAVATHALAIRAIRARLRSELPAPEPRSGDVALLT